MIKPYVLVFLLMASLVSAHGEVDDGHESDMQMPYSVEIESRPVFPIQNVPTELTIHIESTAADHQHLTGLKPVMEILREEHELEEDTQNLGHYHATYTFTTFGQEEMTIRVGGAEYVYSVEVLRPQNNFATVFLFATFIVLGTGLIVYFTFVKRKLKIWSGIFYFVILLIISGIGYSLYEYTNSEAVQGCMIQIGDVYVYHCHQDIAVNICGEDKAFDWEGGILNRGHTHKGDYKIHWHPESPEPDPYQTMTLRHLFEDFGLEISETSIQDPKTKKLFSNNACNDANPDTVKVYEVFDGAEREIADWLDYGLQDETEYKIVYG